MAERDDLVSDMHHHIAQLTEELQQKADEVWEKSALAAWLFDNVHYVAPK